MQVAVVLLALLSLSYSVPQPRKLFHEHFEDFNNVILKETGEELNDLMAQYSKFKEFQASFDYLVTPNFRNLIYEMEDISEFKAVVDFLENHGIDILYFFDAINAFVDGVQENREKGKGRNLNNQLKQLSGRDATGFILDCIEIYPKSKLTALYDEKMVEDDGFRRAIESFDTEEWNELYSALWQNETFLNEVAIIKENGLDIKVLLIEYKNILGIY